MTPEELSEYAYNCDYLAPDSPDSEDRYVVKLVLRATLIFRDGHTPAIREALKKCFDEYFSAFGDRLKWGWDPQPASGKPTPRRFDKKLVESTHRAFVNIKPDGAVLLAFMSGKIENYIDDFGIKCMTATDWEQAIDHDASYLSFWIPHDMVQNDKWDNGKFPLDDFLVLCCNRLNAVHGYAGFAIALPHESHSWEPYWVELAEQYYCLEIDNPIITMLMTEGWKGIKGVNW